MASPAEHPLARRYRAARAWADLDQDELAARLGVDRQTIIRRESGEKLPKTAELLALSTVCKVPQEFMLHGFADEVLGTEETRAIGDRLEAIEAAVSLGDQLEQELEAGAGTSDQPADDSEEDEPGQPEEGSGP